ncbi:hypothetical protein ACVWXM_003436 [Bradyrhizobium sp. GM7.3]
MVINSRFFNRSELMGFLVLAAVLFVILPLSLDVFRLNLVAKYLTYAFVALGLVLCWGYGGILSLGQGVFFGLGGYCMAMFLKLEASSVENTKIQSTPGIPDFMDWNQITSLPLFWQPFHSLAFTILAIILVPGIFALIIGTAMFKRRVGGTYFAIITQAVAAILTILIVGQQGYTGGINGMTDLRTLKGWDIRPDHAKVILYFVEVVLLFACIGIAQFIRLTKLGPHPGGYARTGGPRPLLRLQRRQLQDLCVLYGRGFRRDRRGHVRAQCRFHVAVLCRHRAVDRDGDLHRGRRTDVDLWRDMGGHSGELRQDQPVGILSATLAVWSRRAVHRGRARFPERPVGALGRLCAAARRPPFRLAQEAGLERQFGCRRRTSRVRRPSCSSVITMPMPCWQ